MKSAALRSLNVFSVIGMVLGVRPAAAETYPSRPITVVVSFAAGGFVNMIARLVGQKLSQRLGQPVIVEKSPWRGG